MHTKLIASTLWLAAALAAPVAGQEAPRAPSREALTPTPAERDARLGWWREARFGMFVHWGVYSGLSGSWNGKAYGGYAEHIQRMAKIPIPTYLKEVAGTFNPAEFNADEWIRLAKEAGMGYFVITAKHHDGFAMYDSQVSAHTIVKATPFQRDPMKELKAACVKYGLKFGFYYSHAFDWGEENGPGNDWDFQNPGGDRLLHGKDWWVTNPGFLPKARRYVDEKSIPQLRELIRQYDPDIIWFDTPHKLPREENLRILAAVRAAKPSLVINGRLVDGCGDYASTCDRPAEFPPQAGDWEGVPTTNESYGYNRNDRSHKPAAHFIRLLAKSAARGGNELMNIGPMGNGRIDAADVSILQGIGAWWKVNGESIRGTNRTPLTVQAWGESTRKGDRLYLHVFQWPRDGRLVVGGLKSEVRQATLLAAPGQALAVARKGLDCIVTVPLTAPDAADSIVVLECIGGPEADPVRLLTPSIPEDTLRAFDASLSGALQFGPGKKTDDCVINWTQKDDAVVWAVRLTEKATFAVAINYDAPKEIKGTRLSEGDAGKEVTRPQKGAAGTYAVAIGGETFVQAVRQGANLTEPLGTVTLEPGNYAIRVSAREIAGQELMRLRRLVLQPAKGAATAAAIHQPVEKDPRVQANGKGWRLDRAVLTNAALPRILLVGDSILNGYQNGVIKTLKGKANVDAWVNPYCQSEKFNGLLAEVLANGPYDVVHINLGLHGWQPGRIPAGQFEALTKAFVAVIRQKCPSAKIIWASTTPIMVKGRAALDPELNPIIIEHNRMAAKVMAEEKVPVIDFYSLMVGRLELAHGNEFHWDATGSRILADAASNAIIAALAGKP